MADAVGGCGRGTPKPGDARWLPPVVVAVLTLATFLPALRCGFVSWDDDRNLLENTGFRSFDAAHIGWMFTKFHGGHYQPLTWLSFALDYRLWGLAPFGFHLTNIVLHALTAVLFYSVARRLLALAHDTEGPCDAGLRVPPQMAWAAAFAALVFAVHPLRVESVVWVTERRDVLSGVFFLACLLAYVSAARSHSWGWHGIAWTMMVLSLSAKAIGLTLPLVMLIIDVYPLRRMGVGGTRAARLIVEKLPYLCLSLVAGWLAVAAQRSAGAWREVDAFGILERLVTAGYGLGFYIMKWVAPHNLSPLYPLPGRAELLSAGHVVVAGGALIGVIVAAAQFRRRPWLAAAVIAYCALLAPVSGVAQSGKHLVADRYSYLALLPLAVLAGAGVLRIAQRAHWRYARIVACVIVVGLAALTMQQAQVWRDSESFWRHVVGLYPDSHVARVGLGNALLDDDRAAEAAEHLRAALAADPADAKAHNGLGRAAMAMDHPQEALAAFARAAELAPENGGYQRNLGYVLAGFGRLEDAAQAYGAAAKIDPSDAAAANMHGVLLRDLGRFADARTAFEIGLRNNADDRALAGSLAWLLATCPQDEVRDGGQALALATDLAQQVQYGDPWVLATLAAALAETGGYEQAVHTVDQALRLAGDASELAARLAKERAVYAAGAAYRDPPPAEP